MIRGKKRGGLMEWGLQELQPNWVVMYNWCSIIPVKTRIDGSSEEVLTVCWGDF